MVITTKYKKVLNMGLFSVILALLSFGVSGELMDGIIHHSAWDDHPEYNSDLSGSPIFDGDINLGNEFINVSGVINGAIFEDYCISLDNSGLGFHWNTSWYANNEVSWSFWIFIQNDTDDSVLERLWEMDGANYFARLQSGGNIYIHNFNSLQNTGQYLTKSMGWVMLTYVQNTSNTELYFNDTKVWGGSGANIPTGERYIGFINRPNSNNWDTPTCAYFDELTIWNRSINEEEISLKWEAETLGGSFSDNWTIPVDNAPNITLLGVNNSYGDWDFTINISADYSTWDFSGFAEGNNLSWVYEAVLNSSDDVLAAENQSDNFVFSVNGSIFTEFSGNFTYLLKVGYDGGIADDSKDFTVWDPVSPLCDSFESANVTNNTAYVWDVDCFDESNFFSLNVTCSDTYTFYQDGINSPVYNFAESSNIITSVVQCEAVYCDGHTSKRLDKQFKGFRDKDNKAVYTDFKGKKNTFKLKSGQNPDIEIIEKFDRISFVFDDKSKSKETQETYIFQYEASPNSYYVASDKFINWVIDPSAGTWFDTNLVGDISAEQSIEEVSPGIYEITITSNSGRLEFESIGQLNCNQTEFTLYPVEANEDISEEVSSPLSSVIEKIFLLVLWVVFLVLTLVLKGNKGNTIGFLNILQMILGFVSGSVWMGDYFLVGFPIILVSIGFFIGLIFQNR